MSKVSGQLFGRDAIAEGYLTDSLGLNIDPGAIYQYEGERYVGITAMWRTGLNKPKKCKQITRAING